MEELQKRLTRFRYDMLLEAYGSKDGKLPTWASSAIDPLLKLGFIELRLVVVDSAARERAEFIKQASITHARDELNTGNWQQALQFLQAADSVQLELNSKGWFITEAGKSAATSLLPKRKPKTR